MRQRGPISAKSYTATIQEVFKNAQLKEKGINIDGEKLSDLRFADDVALRTEEVKDMGHQFEEVKDMGHQLHTHTRDKKSKVLCLRNSVLTIYTWATRDKGLHSMISHSSCCQFSSFAQLTHEEVL